MTMRTRPGTQPWTARLGLAALLVGATLGTASSALAQEPHRDRVPQQRALVSGPGRGEWLDNRYNHGHYYPPHGAVFRELPGGYRPYFWHGNNYYFNGGIWYSPGPRGFVVIGPPVGLFVATLPPFYTTVWLGGSPYYYANDTYYQWSAAQNGYTVANPPAGADQPGGPPPDAAAAVQADNAYIYPKNGQSQEQQAADRFECHDWARNQTGFDPTQAGGGVAPAENGSKREQYQRAMGACLEARGYSVK
jgi:hypothetical protein